MKNRIKNRDKKRKYSAPKINKHDTKSLMSDWSFGVYGALEPTCTCGA